jgi:hypothetical protein
VAALTSGTADFLERLLRLDANSLVRLRGTELWSRVPWNVMVMRAGTASRPADFTVNAAEWLALGDEDPSALEHLDAQWRAGLPTGPIVVRETMPAHIIRRISEAAAETLRETESSGLRGRAVGARALRDALLDHVPIIVAADAANPTPVRVPQRIVQAVVRMGFLPTDDGETVQIVTTGPWIGIATGTGAAWWRTQSGLTLNPYRA